MVLAVSMLAMVSGVVWADWVISCCGVSSEAMFQSQMVRSGKTGGGHKNGYIWEAVSWIELRLAQHLSEVACYAVDDWQWCQGHDDVTTGANGDVASQKWEIQSYLCSYYHFKWTNDMEPC